MEKSIYDKFQTSLCFPFPILCNLKDGSVSGRSRSLGNENFNRARVSQTRESNYLVRHIKGNNCCIRIQQAKGGMIKIEGTAVSLPLVGFLNLVLFSFVYFTLSYNFSVRRVFWGFTIFFRSAVNLLNAYLTLIFLNNFK